MLLSFLLLAALVCASDATEEALKAEQQRRTSAVAAAHSRSPHTIAKHAPHEPDPYLLCEGALFRGPYSGQGLLFFAYGTQEATARFLREAVASASRIRRLNSGVNMTLVTMPFAEALPPDLFDVVIYVDQGTKIEGKRVSWKPSLTYPEEWSTRFLYMTKSPYKVTLALDSQALCCSSGVSALFDAFERSGVDIAYGGAWAREPRLVGLHPHNWAIMWKSGPHTAKLFHYWMVAQKAYGRTQSDQGTLYAATGYLALKGKLNFGILSPNAALALEHTNPRATNLLDVGPGLFMHLAPQSEADADRICSVVNENVQTQRVLFCGEPDASSCPHAAAAYDAQQLHAALGQRCSSELQQQASANSNATHFPAVVDVRQLGKVEYGACDRLWGRTVTLVEGWEAHAGWKGAERLRDVVEKYVAAGWFHSHSTC